MRVQMKSHVWQLRVWSLVLAGVIVGGALLSVTVRAQSSTASTGGEARQAPTSEAQERWEAEFGPTRRYWRRVLRIGQDYALRAGETARGVTVAFGSARIAGRVNGDLVVLFGPLTLASTAVVQGGLVVVGGEATVEQGAVVRDAVVAVGANLNLPSTFYFGGEHIVIGARPLGVQIESVLPWITGGLLLGRPIAPGVGWVWSVVGIFLLVYALLTLIAHGPVRGSAEMLATRPFGSFVVGVLVLLLTGPLAALLVVSVVGVLVMPFLLAAVVAAGVLGRVSVLRWLGDSAIRSDDADSRLQGLRSVLIGFALLTLLYMVPFLGLMVWALVGVLGLGAVVLAFLSAWRREHPRSTSTPAPTPPTPPTPPTSPSGSVAMADPAPLANDLWQAPASMSPPVSSEGAPWPEGAAAPQASVPSEGAWHRAEGDASRRAGGTGDDLTRFPRAMFLDRAAAFAVDVVLVAIAYQVLSGPFRWRGDDVVLPLLLVYFIGFWAWKGTSMGGIITNLRVVKTTGASLEFADAVVRGLMGVLSFALLGIGVLWIIRDPERQAWHDKAAGTYVVKVPKDLPLA